MAVVYIDPASTEFVHEEFLPGLLRMVDDSYPTVNLLAGVPSRPKGYQFKWAADRGTRPTAKPGYDARALPDHVPMDEVEFNESLAFTYNVMQVSGQVTSYDQRSAGAYMPSMVREAQECVRGLRIIEERMILAPRKGAFAQASEAKSVTGSATALAVDGVQPGLAQDFAYGKGVRFRVVANPDGGSSDSDKGEVELTAAPTSETSLMLKRTGGSNVSVADNDYLMYNYDEAGVGGSQALNTLHELIGSGSIHGQSAATFPLWGAQTATNLAVSARMLDQIFVNIQRARGVDNIGMLPMLMLCSPELKQKINQLADGAGLGGSSSGGSAQVRFESGQQGATAVRTFNLNFGDQTVRALAANKLTRRNAFLLDQSMFGQVGGDAVRMVSMGGSMWRPVLTPEAKYTDQFIAHIRMDRQLFVRQRNCQAHFTHAAVTL